MEIYYTGILEDNRSQAEKKRDFDPRELDLGSLKLVSKEEAVLNAFNYISRNQWYKSSCVPSSMANALWNTEKIELADEPWYKDRINSPAQGCYWYDIANMVIKRAYKRSDCPEVKTEDEANKYKTPTGIDTETHRQKAYFFISNGTMTIVQFITLLNSNIAIPFSIYAVGKEWSRKVPKIYDKDLTIDKATINHAICAIPNTGYEEDGEYHFMITDSAHFGGFDKRTIDQSFFDIRWKHGVYFVDLEKEDTDGKIKTKYNFTRNLTVGSRGEDVKILQTILRELGFLSSKWNGVYYDPTTYFGGMTKAAVAEYQKSRNITPAVGYFGPITRKKIMSEM